MTASHRTLSEDQQILNIREAVEKRRSPLAAWIEWMQCQLVRPRFFAALLVLHLVWVIANIPAIVPWEPVDPYPFTFLATVASVEAPFLALLILMVQHRNQRIAELRDEVDVQVALYLERELTAVHITLNQLADRFAVDTGRSAAERQQLETPLDADRLMEHVQWHLDKSTGEAID